MRLAALTVVLTLALPVDARAYHQKALRILSGELVAERAFYQDPLYPYFLSLLYGLAGPSPWAARALQMLLGVFSTGLVVTREPANR